MNVAFIQARMNSTRLPGKVLLSVGEHRMLWHVWWRISQAETLDNVVIITGDHSKNSAIANFCAKNNIPCFRGSENDVLDRFYEAATAYHADTVVRVTGDCPLVDPEVTDLVVREYYRHNLEFCATSPSYTYPDGFGTEVFSMDALSKAHEETQTATEREHVTVFMRKNPDRFRSRFVENEVYHPFTDVKLSVDDEHDLKLIRTIFTHLLAKNRLFHLQDVIELLQRHPEWLTHHPMAPINEGYFKSFFSEPDRLRPKTRQVRLDRSKELLARATQIIPSCTQTFSKGYAQYVQGVSPVFVERGEGGCVYDVDGNKYIDYPLGLGPITVGHCHPEVDDAVIAQVRKGPQHSLPHRLEVELAERLCEIIPCAEMVRFGKNGSDATAGAVRVARAITGREKILCCGYHGWQDWYIGTTQRRRGVPRSTQELTMPFPYNDIGALERLLQDHHNQVAAIIMEPVGTILSNNGYLAQVKEVAHYHGTLLIFDEIVTGFRVALGGAQQYFGVVPDMACIGKGMANGYPLSAVVGYREVMQEFDRSFFSFTFGGEAVSLAAALATLHILERDNAISHMWILGRRLKDGYNYLARHYGLEAYTWCQGLPPRAGIVFKDINGGDSLVYKGIFQQECIKRGVLFNGVHKFCLMHSNEQIDYTLAVYDEAFQVLRKASQADDPSILLKGPVPEPVFRRVDY